MLTARAAVLVTNLYPSKYRGCFGVLLHIAACRAEARRQIRGSDRVGSKCTERDWALFQFEPSHFYSMKITRGGLRCFYTFYQLWLLLDIHLFICFAFLLALLSSDSLHSLEEGELLFARAWKSVEEYIMWSFLVEAGVSNVNRRANWGHGRSRGAWCAHLWLPLLHGRCSRFRKYAGCFVLS